LFWNEWDCCEEFEPPDSDDNDDDYYKPGKLDKSIHPNLEYESLMLLHQKSPSLPLTTDKNQPVEEHTYEVINMLSMHYGFTLPLPVPN